jgi:signal transduction histidine kinase
VKRSAWLAYVLLVSVPALLAAAGAMLLLHREQQRIARQAFDAAIERAHTLADTVRWQVAAAQQELLGPLQKTPAAELPALLERWRGENPLVRNVFAWHPAAGVTNPVASSATAEERGFLLRFADLFADAGAWSAPASDTAAAPLQSFSDSLRTRRYAPAEAAGPRAGGWVPWFHGSRLHLLGWTEMPDGRRFGVEMETSALLARILAAFPSPPDEHTVYGIVDDAGAVVHQAGGELTGWPLEAEAPLSPTLPHWRVVISGGHDRVAGGRPFFLLSALLVASLLGAILVGAALLAAEAGRSARDAARKTSFVSNVSHELKTPLTALRMHAELVRDGRLTGPEDVRQSLDTIVSESERLTRLVNNVLDFSRLEQGRRRYRVEPLDAAERVRDVLESQRPRLAAAGLNVRTSYPAAPARAYADRDALEQALVNLLDNAAKYAASGGALEIEVAPAAGAVEVRVMDRGPGIPPAHRGRLFTRFHRVDDSLTARQPGCGLGLGIARGLLRGMGGDVEYAPRDGGGCVFTIRLPGEPA